MKKKNAFFIVLLLNIVFIFIYFFMIESEKKLSELPKVEPGSINDHNKIIDSGPLESKENTNVTSYCLEEFSKNNFKELERSSELLWRNIHIENPSGIVYRVRYFYDDGPNGQFKKTIVYKENDEGFPLIHKKLVGFSDIEEKSLLKNGKIIWEERAFNSPNDLYWRVINNKVVEFKSKNQKQCNL
ncbi:hypothetical protein [Halobacteriovorax sp. HLS]|uniref:hypothetical protein n=1 Tax=Halobacteriovorax sp. HLS TaxID=2234000 RepID=UPI000FD8122B|nr:hypothetical protein [Halobacteriovorax sp. HLS]